MKHSSFRPLGVSLRDFARQRIRSYVPSGDVVSRAPLPPSWASDSRAELQWEPGQNTPVQPPALLPQATPAQLPDVEALLQGQSQSVAPASVGADAPAVQREVAAPVMNDEARLKAIMAAHEQKRKADAAAAAVPADAIQRSPDFESAANSREYTPASASSAASSVEAAAPIPRRRRGMVMDVTPPQPTGVFDERLWDSMPPRAADSGAAHAETPPSVVSPAPAVQRASLGEDTPAAQALPAEDASPELAAQTSQSGQPPLPAPAASPAPATSPLSQASSNSAIPGKPSLTQAVSDSGAGPVFAPVPAERTVPAEPSAQTQSSAALTPSIGEAAAPSVVQRASVDQSNALPAALERAAPLPDGPLAEARTAAPAGSSLPVMTTSPAPAPAVQRAAATDAAPKRPSLAQSPGQPAAHSEATPSLPGPAAPLRTAAADTAQVTGVAAPQDSVEPLDFDPFAVELAAPPVVTDAPPVIQRVEMPAATPTSSPVPGVQRRADPPPTAGQSASGAQPASQATNVPLETSETPAISRAAQPVVQRAEAPASTRSSPPRESMPEWSGPEGSGTDLLDELDAPFSAETRPIVPARGSDVETAPPFAETQPITPVRLPNPEAASSSPATQSAQVMSTAPETAVPPFRMAETNTAPADAQTLMLKRAEAPLAAEAPDVPRGPVASAPVSPPDRPSSGLTDVPGVPVRPATTAAGQPPSPVQRVPVPEAASASANSVPQATPAISNPVPQTAPGAEGLEQALRAAETGPSMSTASTPQINTAAAPVINSPAPAAAVQRASAQGVSAPTATPTLSGPAAPVIPAPAPETQPAQPVSSRSTLPDAPTLLEPAAAPSIADMMQRAIGAAESSARPADSPVSMAQDGFTIEAPAAPAPPTPRPAPVVLDSRLQPSPWSSFIDQPVPPAPSRVPAPPVVQRAPAPPPAPPARLPAPESTSQPASEQLVAPEAELPLQKVDLAEALLGSEAPAPAVRQPPAPATRAAPSASVQRKAATGEVTSLPDASLPAESDVPVPGSVEAAMLDLLNLPPDTSVAGLKSVQGRRSAESPPSTSPSGPSIQRMPLDQALASGSWSDRPSGQIQRAETESPPEAPANEQVGEDGAAGEPNVEDLARKVYGILKDRLRVERERSAR